MNFVSQFRSLARQVKMYGQPPTATAYAKVQATARDQARRAEFHRVSTAATALMTDNSLASLPNPSQSQPPPTE